MPAGLGIFVTSYVITPDLRHKNCDKFYLIEYFTDQYVPWYFILRVIPKCWTANRVLKEFTINFHSQFSLVKRFYFIGLQFIQTASQYIYLCDTLNKRSYKTDMRVSLFYLVIWRQLHSTGSLPSKLELIYKKVTKQEIVPASRIPGLASRVPRPVVFSDIFICPGIRTTSF